MSTPPGRRAIDPGSDPPDRSARPRAARAPRPARPAGHGGARSGPCVPEAIASLLCTTVWDRHGRKHSVAESRGDVRHRPSAREAPGRSRGPGPDAAHGARTVTGPEVAPSTLLRGQVCAPWRAWTKTGKMPVPGRLRRRPGRRDGPSPEGRRVPTAGHPQTGRDGRTMLFRQVDRRPRVSHSATSVARAHAALHHRAHGSRPSIGLAFPVASVFTTAPDRASGGAPARPHGGEAHHV